jgi:hypothetical protein
VTSLPRRPFKKQLSLSIGDMLKRTGVAELPLHPGKCPPWLFVRMKRLGGAITEVIVHEYGRQEFIRRMSDPFFFQALSCVLGYDWHSSGTTTVTMGALKEAVNPNDFGVAICGGKGKVSKKAPNEIQKIGDDFSLNTKKIERLKYASKMSAKVDNACVQDGYQLYHHCFVLSEDGDWAVVQQGMHDRLARRYHWLSEGVHSFVEEPHSGIMGERREEVVLDMTAHESEDAREASVDLVRDNPRRLMGYVREAEQKSLDEYFERSPQVMKLVMPTGHAIADLTERTIAALGRAYEIRPENYEELVAIRGIGPKAVRALALVSDLIYGKSPSWKDPARYSFAHGGKDGIPFPVDRPTYKKTTEILEGAIQDAKIGQREKIDAVKRLREFL